MYCLRLKSEAASAPAPDGELPIRLKEFTSFPLSWVSIVLSYSDDEVAQLAGVDALMYLIFVRSLLKVNAPTEREA